jgi:hypothetical protein
MCSGALLGIVRAIVTGGSTITTSEVLKVILFGALGALAGLVVKDVYEYFKNKFK